jgi:hypothetical protein
VVLAAAAFHACSVGDKTQARRLADSAVVNGVPPDCPAPSIVYLPRSNGLTIADPSWTTTKRLPTL